MKGSSYISENWKINVTCYFKIIYIFLLFQYHSFNKKKTLSLQKKLLLQCALWILLKYEEISHLNLNILRSITLKCQGFPFKNRKSSKKDLKIKRNDGKEIWRNNLNCFDFPFIFKTYYLSQGEPNQSWNYLEINLNVTGWEIKTISAFSTHFFLIFETALKYFQLV